LEVVDFKYEVHGSDIGRDFLPPNLTPSVSVIVVYYYARRLQKQTMYSAI